MTWTCSECRQDFTPDDKKYKFNLCHICYFNPAIAKLYRTGEKTPLPDEALALVEPIGPQALTNSVGPTGPVGDDVGLMLVIQREMEYDIGCLMEKVPPGRKPDITKIAYDLGHLKLLMFKLFVQMGVEITPEMKKEFMAPPALRPPNMNLFKVQEVVPELKEAFERLPVSTFIDPAVEMCVKTMSNMFKVKETGRWSAANPPQCAMFRRWPPQSMNFLDQLSQPPCIISPFSQAQSVSLQAISQEPDCEGE
jgi:hypothetical protein